MAPESRMAPARGAVRAVFGRAEPVPSVTALARGGPAESIAFALFLCVGLFLPFYAFPVFSVGGKSFDLATIFAGCFAAVSFIVLGLRRRAPAAGGLVLLAAAVPLLVLIEPRPSRFDASRFASSFGHWLLVLSVFFGASLLRLDRSSRRWVVAANGLAGGAVAAFGLYQAVGHRAGWPGTGRLLVSSQREPLRFLQIGTSGYLRPTSVFLEPAWLGGYLAFALAALLGLVFARALQGRISRAILVAALAAVLLCILATVSWGAYADLTVVLAVSLWSLRERFRARPRVAAAVAAALAVIVVVAALSPPGRGATSAALQRWRRLLETPVSANASAHEVADSSWMRSENLRHTIELIRDHPWRGVGLGQFGQYARTSGIFISMASTRDPWCGWLAIAAESGLLAPLVLAGLLLAVLVRRSAGRTAGRNASDDTFRRATVPALLLLAAVQQVHTGSYIDLWWWYPLSVSLALSAPPEEPPAILSFSP